MRMNVPKLRFKADDGTEFSEWEEKKIGDLIEIYDEKVNSDCELPILTSSKKYGIQFQNDHFGREQLHDISGYNVLPYGYCTYRNRSDGTDFTFNINTLCKRGIVSKFYPVFTSKTTDLYVLTSLLNNEKSTVKKIAYAAKGTGQKVLSISDLQNINVRIPCVAEQKKIASFLLTIDEIITATEAELTTWEEHKKGVMQKIFNREVRFKADDGSEFPEWEEKKMTELFTRIVEKNRTDLSPLTIIQGKGTVRRDESDRRIAYDKKGLKNYKAVKKDDFIVHLRSFEGGLEIANQDGIVSPAYHVYRGNGNVCPQFYYSYFRSNNFIKGRLAICVTGVRDGKNIEMDTFDELLLPCPSHPEQKKPADCFSSLDDVINQIQAELSVWKEFKKGLLQQMFV